MIVVNDNHTDHDRKLYQTLRVLIKFTIMSGCICRMVVSALERFFFWSVICVEVVKEGGREGACGGWGR